MNQAAAPREGRETKPVVAAPDLCLASGGDFRAVPAVKATGKRPQRRLPGEETISKE
jgi:hypothetical protein